jgi:predicted nucleic acid-binding protein
MPERAEFVVDNSVVTGWWHAAQAGPYSRAVRDAIPRATAHAPALWPLEFANQLRRARLERRITVAEAASILESIRGLDIQVDVTPPDPAAVLEASLRYSLTAYDAAYLLLAIRLGVPLATIDSAMARAARATGIGVFKP